MRFLITFFHNKNMKRYTEVFTIKKIFKGIIKLIVGFVILAISYIGINEGMAAYTHQEIQRTYLFTTVPYVYVESRENVETSITVIESVLAKFPVELVDEFKENWIIIISSMPPNALSESSTIAVDRASGLNLGTSKTIWISSYMLDMLEEIVAHEFGHFVAYELGGADYSEPFVKLYNDNKNNFVQYGENETDKHNISTSNEFFAMLCEQYVRYPEYMKENYNGCYEFVDKMLKQKAYPFFGSRYINEFKSTISISISQIKKRI